jgi:hypothetical protein
VEGSCRDTWHDELEGSCREERCRSCRERGCIEEQYNSSTSLSESLNRPRPWYSLNRTPGTTCWPPPWKRYHRPPKHILHLCAALSCPSIRISNFPSPRSSPSPRRGWNPSSSRDWNPTLRVYDGLINPSGSPPSIPMALTLRVLLGPSAPKSGRAG